jgi:hypothetical protein
MTIKPEKVLHSQSGFYNVKKKKDSRKNVSIP